ncbi:30S ribosomal protein S14 type Z [Labeo rohita]|uniref:30S ribosomal protein S14 type Z n=1 Tax=Labeo rohita TaxID=84645 RepID=A0ABQ8MS80_LABRO|nr:30S ribosomal protein S14 type Z [Labeo rohita]
MLPPLNSHSISAGKISCGLILHVGETDRARKVKLSSRPASLPQKAVVHILPVDSKRSTTSTVILLDVSNPEHLKIWPHVFLRCQNKDQNHEILEKLGSPIYDFKSYSDDRQIGQVAEALV